MRGGHIWGGLCPVGPELQITGTVLVWGDDRCCPTDVPKPACDCAQMILGCAPDAPRLLARIMVVWVLKGAWERIGDSGRVHGGVVRNTEDQEEEGAHGGC